jgi:hypothetical protein
MAVQSKIPIGAMVAASGLGKPQYTGPQCAHRLSMPRSNYIWNAVAALILGFVCGAALWLELHPKPASSLTAPPVRGVFLHVDPDGRALHLSWNRKSETIRNATNAKLYIEDGTHHSQLDLDPRKLSVGTLSYWPETELVKFRLEVDSSTGTTEGAVQFANSAPPPPKAIAAPAEVVAARRTPQRHPVRTASRAALDEAKPSPFNPSPPPKAIAPLAASEAAVAASEPSAKPAEVRSVLPPVRTSERSLSMPARPVPASAQPVSRSLLGRVVHKIPLVRRLRRRTDQREGAGDPVPRASSGRPD